MPLIEIVGDLFTCLTEEPKYSLGHCVSSDFEMGKGIAVSFRQRFGCLEELRNLGLQVGGAAVIVLNDRFIYYLVTKARYWEKPSYETLKSSLEKMKSHALSQGVTQICLPRIGCGLDKLEWSVVRSIIDDLFRETNVFIKIYYL
jgi:O-acetyl-ADP-ribose deacetylase (regulator of RNase III)